MNMILKLETLCISSVIKNNLYISKENLPPNIHETIRKIVIVNGTFEETFKTLISNKN